MTVIRNKVALKHAIADLLYGDKDTGEIHLNVDKTVFNETVKDIVGGEPIFKSPEIDTKLKVNPNTVLTLK